MDAGAAQQVDEYGFQVVVGVVGGEQAVVVMRAEELVEPVVPEPAGGHLGAFARLRLALETVASALAEAGLTARALAGGLTGFGAAASDAVRQLVHAVIGVPPESILVMDDIVLGYMAQFAPGEGHLISAGTGTIGFHATADGDFVRVGGRGILIDDAGSGSWIALRALDQMYRALDRDGDFGAVAPLAEKLFAAVGGEGWGHVRQFVYAGDRGRIGGLAVAVAQAAQAGDAVALDILGKAGDELANLAEALLARVGERPVCLVGGVLQLHPVIFARVEQRLVGRIVMMRQSDAALTAARLLSSGENAWRALLTGPKALTSLA